jgi:peptidoglycan/LPS O-acetylase OafA/YrhL
MLLLRMPDRISIVKHEAVSCGSYEVRFADGRQSKFFCWDEAASRRLRPDMLTSEQALERARAFARAEQDKDGIGMCARNEIAADRFKAIRENAARMTKPLLSPHATDNYRPDIDGLRAFAVLSVVFYHAFPKAISGGYVGVDIFFVISGFLISSILFNEMTEGDFSFTIFYGRRIRRIFPALAVCLTAVLAYGFVSLTPSELAQLGKHVFFGAGFLSNIALWSESGYFDGAATLKPLLHLWSLGIEEQFYIFWPALLWVVFRMKAKVGRLLAALFLASFAINIALSITNIADDFYLPVSRFWELLAGAVLAWRRPIFLAPNVRSWISFVGSAALLASAALFTPGIPFPGWPALLPVMERQL